MKYKNYKSAIHNFSHSFMSIDYTKSGRLAVNVIINLYKIGKKNKATFDFIKKEIIPKEAETEGSKQLLKDYLNWLPEHFKKHDCDFTKLEKLEVTIWTDFNKALIPGNQAQRSFRQAHARVVTSNTYVCRHREFEAATQSKTVDRRNDRCA